jgi:hypothetical protein
MTSPQWTPPSAPDVESPTVQIPVQRQVPPPFPPHSAATPTPPRKPRRKGGWIVLGGLVVLAVGAIAIGGTGTPSTSTTSTTASAEPAAATCTSPAGCAKVPYLVGMSGPAASAAMDQAGFTGGRENFAQVPTGATVTVQDPKAGTLIGKTESVNLTFAAPAAAPAPVTTAAPTPPKAITAREWALIAKNPDAHIGERVIVYGEVTQFDSATGDSGFRANVDGVNHPIKYGYADYDTNTVLSATSASILNDLVQDDVFKAEVTVLGSYSYDTQIGGSTTVPSLAVTKITVTGSTK